jgi:hypothetical protein
MTPQLLLSLLMTDFDFVLRYWRQQGTYQKIHWQVKVFIPQRVFLFKHVTSQSSAWALPSFV